MSFLNFAIFLIIISFIGRIAFKFLFLSVLTFVIVYFVSSEDVKDKFNKFTSDNYEYFFTTVKKVNDVSAELAKQSSEKLEKK